MKLTELHIQNFRAIRYASFGSLGNTVVIAGPNGCGKSAVLDAIRLLKSACGGYRQNELQQFFSEFQIQARSGIYPVTRLLQDQHKSLRISARFTLARAELDYLNDRAEQLLRPWVVRELSRGGDRGEPQLASNYEFESKVGATLKDEVEEFRTLLRAAEGFDAEVSSEPSDHALRYAASPVLVLLFSTFDPPHAGIFDFHGANRAYQREQLGGVNLDTSGRRETSGQHALYQTENKYKNIKQEMASSFLREMIAIKAGVSPPEGSDLTSTLQSLFDLFFPGKSFLGPWPTADGRLAFEVQLSSGSQHDIDDLSSGEKEILYGYLRLRDMEPRYSVLLFDEPELHLNPRLVRDLPTFYQDYLGRPYENQILLVTHSDAFLRQAINKDDFCVFHMQPADRAAENQVSIIEAKEEVTSVLIELVGEVADFTPGAKVVILEGGGDTEFDRDIIRTLFPDFALTVNLISSGNARRVQQLHDLLERIHEGKRRFFSIRDRDFEEDAVSVPVERRYRWNVYHIENYMLEARYILRVMKDIGRTKTNFGNEAEVYDALKQCAREIVDDVVRGRVEYEVRKRLKGCIRTASDRSKAVDEGVQAAVTASAERLSEAALFLRTEGISRLERERRADWEGSLDGDEWRQRLPGARILARFEGRHIGGLGYERFRALILASMRDGGFQPDGMREIVSAIESAEVD